MSDSKVLDLDLRASDNTILASTYGRGLFTSTFTSAPLSILENEVASNQISVYPTVSNGRIHIASKSDFGTTKLEVYNVGGQKVFNKSIDLSVSTINLSLQLSSGMYFMKFNGPNFTETKRIVIK
jgi:hypothetical protein